MRKDIGNKHQQARAAAVQALDQYKDRNVQDLKTNEGKDVLLKELSLSQT
jgi:hypothetical protein